MESQIKVEKLPDTPGVYFFLDKKKRILYIGKAGSLRARVRSYLAKDILMTRGAGIERMLEEARDIDFQKTDSVLEAVILEAALIKKHQPKYNVREKDDKSFNYVVITKEEYPRVLLVRGKELSQGMSANLKSKILTLKSSYGPFPQAGVLKDALSIIRKIFPYRDTCVPCGKKVGQITPQLQHTNKLAVPVRSLVRRRENVGMSLGGDNKSARCKPCFNKQIGLCPGVCTGEISKKEYQKTIRNIKLLFEGRKSALLKKLEREMKQAAKAHEFEKAAELRNTIFALKHIQDIALLKHEKIFLRNSAFVLRGSAASTRVEAYDVAHTAGKEMVGVMTVIEGGEPQKSEYRKFKLKTVHTANDPAALKEILERRLKHDEWTYPDLIVVDGGKAQINSAERVLRARRLTQNKRRKTQKIVRRPMSKNKTERRRTSFTSFSSIVGVVKDERHRPKRIEGDKDVVRRYEREILLANAEAHRFALKFHRARSGKIT